MGATAGTASACGCSKDQEVDVEVTSVPPALPAPGPNADNDLQAHAQVDLGGAAAVPGPQKGRRRSLLLRDALVPDLDILRGVSVKDTLSGFGRLWRYSPMDLSEELRLAMWDRSRQMESFDLFLSHTWRTRGLWKFLALTLQCGWQRLLLSWFIASILAETLAFFDILPFHMNFTAVFEGDSYVFPFGAWGLFLANLAPVVTAIVAPGGAKDCFLDIVSINQVDEDLMERGIYGLGGCLAVSKELRILWSKPYLCGFGDYLHVVATEWMLLLAMAAFVAKSPWPVALRTGAGSTDVYPLCGAVQFATHPVALGTLCSCWALCVVLICILRLQPAFCQHVVVLADFLPAYAGERHADVTGDAVMNCSTNAACTRLASECHGLPCELRAWHHRVSTLRYRVFDEFGRILCMVCFCHMHLRAVAIELGMRGSKA